MQEKQALNSSDSKLGSSSEKKPSLKRNYIDNFISQILTLIITIATTPYLSRVLHEEGNGKISYASSILAIFLMLASFGFDSYGQREIAKCRDDLVAKSKTLWEIVVMRTITTIAISIVLYSVLFTVGFSKANDLILIFSIQLVGNIFDINYFYRGEEDFRSIALRTILLKVSGLVCVFVFVKTQDDIGIYALCISISSVLSNLILWPPLFRKVKKVPFSCLSFKRHLLPSLEIFIPTLATTIFSVMDKTEIGWFAENSDYENGCYEQAYKINSVALMLVTVISPILAPRNAFDFKNGDMTSLKSHLRFSFQYTWLFGTPLIIGFAVMSSNLSSWFLGPGYAKVPLLMQIMSVRFIASGFGETLGSDLFIPIGKEKYATIAACIGAVVNVITNYFFIRLWGATGAAITTAASEIIVTSFLLFLAFKKHFITLEMIFSGVWKYLVAGGLMFVVIFFMNQHLPYTIWYFLLIVSVGSILYFLALFFLKDSMIYSLFQKMKTSIFKKKHQQ